MRFDIVNFKERNELMNDFGVDLVGVD